MTKPIMDLGAASEVLGDELSSDGPGFSEEELRELGIEPGLYFEIARATAGWLRSALGAVQSEEDIKVALEAHTAAVLHMGFRLGRAYGEQPATQPDGDGEDSQP